MLKIDWGIVLSILTALGIFELIKRTLIFWLENNIFRKNLEIRDIADRALVYCNNLKLRNFEEPLSIDEVRQLRLDITKIDSMDKSLGDNLMALINDPWLIKIYHQNSLNDQSGEFIKLMTQCHTELHNKIDRLVPKLNRLRYKPILEINMSTKKSGGKK